MIVLFLLSLYYQPFDHEALHPKSSPIHCPPCFHFHVLRLLCNAQKKQVWRLPEMEDRMGRHPLQNRLIGAKIPFFRYAFSLLNRFTKRTFALLHD